MIIAPSSIGKATDGRAAWRKAVGLALVSLLCSGLLGGVSAWLLGSVALAGLSAAAFTFNIHVPAALVRLFAVGRTAAKYGERLLGHKAALADQVWRRAALVRAMAHAPSVRAAGWQLGDMARLADYLDDVEDLDYGALRVDLPAAACCACLVALLAATAIMTPLALGPIGALGLAIALVGAKLSRTGAKAWQASRTLQRDGAQGLGMALASVIPLKAEDAWTAVTSSALDRLSRAEQAMLAVDRRKALLDALAALLGPVALSCVIGTAWIGGQRGDALLAPVFLGFAWLALGEVANGLSRIYVAQFRREAARAEIARWTGAAPDPADVQHLCEVATLDLSNFPRRAPDGRVIGRPISLRLERGRPTVLAGASGCGKTSLLKQIAGWIGDDMAAVGAMPVAALDRRALSCFCPHDAATLDDTVRGNLFAPHASDARHWQALAAVEMEERVRRAGGLDAWISQDILSLGEAQRLGLARAFLSDRPIVVIDEPTEHLDREQGGRILARLAAHLSDRILILSSHHEAAIPGAVVVQL